MATLAIDMANTGFTNEDRQRFERLDARVEEILRRLDDLMARLRSVEADKVDLVTREEFRDVLVSVDDLRSGKADKHDLSARNVVDHETRIRLIEAGISGIKESVDGVRADLEPLKEWRWKQWGALIVIAAIMEALARVLFK